MAFHLIGDHESMDLVDKRYELYDIHYMNSINSLK